MSGGNEVELFPGDELQIDGGVLVVETVGSKSAEGVLKGGDGKLVEVRNPYLKHLVLSRGNKPEAKTQPRKSKSGMVRLEPGDQLCHGGEVRTVVEITDKAATIENDAGQQFKEKRFVNEFLFTDCNTNEVRRLDAAQRAAHLKDFLGRRKSLLAETEKEQGDKTQSEGNMSRKAKTEKNDKGEAKRHGAEDADVQAFIKEQKKANNKVTLGGLVKAFRATGQSCSQQRMAALFAKG